MEDGCALRGCLVTTADYFSMATALQTHEMNVIRAYREQAAETLRAEADAYELEAQTLADKDALEKEWIAFGIRIAAVRIAP